MRKLVPLICLAFPVSLMAATDPEMRFGGGASSPDWISQHCQRGDIVSPSYSGVAAVCDFSEPTITGHGGQYAYTWCVYRGKLRPDRAEKDAPAE